MNNTSKNTTLLSLVVIGGVALLTTSSVFAFGGQGEGEGNGDREQIKIAVEANDYSLIPTEAQDKIDEEKFAEIVANNATKQARKTQLESAVAAGDFATFSSLKEEFTTEKSAAKEAKMAEKLADATEEEKAMIEEKMANKAERKSEKTAPTEAEQEEKFNEMVTYFQENGELPTKSKSGKRGGGTKGGGK